MDKSAVFLLIFSIVLLLIGFNFVFNPHKVIAKFISLTKYKEGTFFHKLLINDSRILWLRIVGVGLMAIALLFGFGMCILF